MLSGGRSQFVALKAKMPWLDINQERHHAYAGYEGMVELVHEIDKALSNPVWEQVRQPAPWDEVTWEQRADAAIAEEAAIDIATLPAQHGSASATRSIVDTIEAVIRKHGLTTVAQVTVRSGAGGGCGGCVRRYRGDPGRDVRRSQRLPREGAMAKVVISKKACTVNPLKMSQPIGGALAFMGVDGRCRCCTARKGCTSFALVLFVRHFREAIPMQTTAMSEVATVLGGFENVEQAVLTIASKTNPAMIGICSTGVTETKGDDVDGYIRLIRPRHPELDHIALVYVSTPDFKDAFQDGWAKAVTRMVEQLVLPTPEDAPREATRVNVLPGCHLTPGDLDELRDILAGFGLQASIPAGYLRLAGWACAARISRPTTNGGIGNAQIAAMGRAGLDHRDRRADARRGRGVAGEDRRSVPVV